MDRYILSKFPTTFSSPLPGFSKAGVLPAGDYAPGRLEFEERFVNIDNVARRKDIYDGWNKHREALVKAGVPGSGRQLVDGSFTTSKPLPGDIDIAVEVRVDDETLSALNLSHPIVRLLQGPAVKSAYKCDAYPIYVLPEDHPLYETVTVKAIEYWTKWFGYSRPASGIISKGRVWVTTGGLQ